MIEIVMAIAILGIIFSLGLIVSMDSYRGYSFRSEVSTIVSVLERARSRSLNNLFQISHGVCYDSGSKNYVIFRGTSYGASNPTTRETVSSNPSLTISPSTSASFFCSSNLGIVFTQLSGTTTLADIVLVQNNRISTTSINHEGTINW